MLNFEVLVTFKKLLMYFVMITMKYATFMQNEILSNISGLGDN